MKVHTPPQQELRGHQDYNPLSQSCPWKLAPAALQVRARGSLHLGLGAGRLATERRGVREEGILSPGQIGSGDKGRTG
jgi:hypothetical protein